MTTFGNNGDDDTVCFINLCTSLILWVEISTFFAFAVKFSLVLKLKDIRKLSSIDELNQSNGLNL